MYKSALLVLSMIAQLGSAIASAGESGSGTAHPALAPADFERALTVNDRYAKLTVNIPKETFWLSEGHAFVYSRVTHGKRELIGVDALTGQSRPAFDQARLAAALTDHTNFEAGSLPFKRFDITDNGRKLSFKSPYGRWNCDLGTYTCKGPERSAENANAGDYRGDGYDDTPAPDNNPLHVSPSPDGKWQAYVKNHNVFVHPKDGSKDIALSWDGSEGDYYAISTLRWSPDSTELE
ncbi:hypothetical protein ACWGS9_33090 [Bradyrhizobium sp. Arg314]